MDSICRKKIVLLCLACTLMSMLISCKGQNEGDDSEFTPISYNSYSTSSGFFVFASEIVESEDGYYILSGRNEDFITRIDKETKEAMVLCSKINCEHSLESVPTDCEAYIGESLLASIQYYDGYIYYISYDKTKYSCVLCRISEDGSEHETVCELEALPDNSNNYYSYVVTDNYIIYSRAVTSLEESNIATLNVLDLATGDSSIIYTYEDNSAQIGDLKVDNDHIYFRQSNTGSLLDSEIYSYNTMNGDICMISDHVSSYTFNSNDNNVIAYWKAYDGAYEYRIDTQETTFLCPVTEESNICFIASGRGEYYVYNFPNKHSDGESSSYHFVGIINDEVLTESLEISHGMIAYVSDDIILFKKWDSGDYLGDPVGYYELEDGGIGSELIITGALTN